MPSGLGIWCLSTYILGTKYVSWLLTRGLSLWCDIQGHRCLVALEAEDVGNPRWVMLTVRSQRTEWKSLDWVCECPSGCFQLAHQLRCLRGDGRKSPAQSCELSQALMSLAACCLLAAVPHCSPAPLTAQGLPVKVFLQNSPSTPGGPSHQGLGRQGVKWWIVSSPPPILSPKPWWGVGGEGGGLLPKGTTSPGCLPVAFQVTVTKFGPLLSSPLLNFLLCKQEMGGFSAPAGTSLVPLPKAWDCHLHSCPTS